MSASVLLTALAPTLTETTISHISLNMLEMNIETLLQAAEYIERRERGKRVVGSKWRLCLLCLLTTEWLY